VSFCCVKEGRDTTRFAVAADCRDIHGAVGLFRTVSYWPLSVYMCTIPFVLSTFFLLPSSHPLAVAAERPLS